MTNVIFLSRGAFICWGFCPPELLSVGGFVCGAFFCRAFVHGDFVHRAFVLHSPSILLIDIHPSRLVNGSQELNASLQPFHLTNT